MLNFTDILYAPVFAALGGPVAILLSDETEINIVAIDKTAGVETAEGSLDVLTIKPAAVVRAADLDELGYSAGSLRNATFAMGGKSWLVENYLSKPSPAGEADGEVYLLLRDLS